MSDFFSGIEQFEVSFQDLKGRVPIFYYDSSASVNMFLASTRKLRKYIDKRIKISELLPGITLLGVVCFEYRKTDIGPYNEIGITVPYSGNIISSFISGRFEVHVWHLPVTTEIAYVAGVQIYNYPKFVADIKFSENHFSLSADGKEIFNVKTSAKIKIPGRKFQFITYQIKDDVLLQTKVDALGKDIYIGFMSSEIYPNTETEIGRELQDVLISRKSLISMNIKDLKAILYLPSKV